MLSFNRGLDLSGDETIDPRQFNEDESFPLNGGWMGGGGGVVIPETPAPFSEHVGGGVAAGQSVRQMLTQHGIQLADTSKESIANLYPNCTRQFNEDFDSYVLVEWKKCSAKQIDNVCSSIHMQCGATKSMAWVMKFAVQQLTGPLSCFCQKVLTSVPHSPCAFSPDSFFPKGKRSSEKYDGQGHQARGISSPRF